jgi:hypothetical protein
MSGPYSDPEDPLHWKNVLKLPEAFKHKRDTPSQEELEMYPEVTMSDLEDEAPKPAAAATQPAAPATQPAEPAPATAPAVAAAPQYVEHSGTGLLPLPNKAYVPAPPPASAQADVTMSGGKVLREAKNWNMVGVLFNIREQIKLYHWQTSSFAQHKTTDDLVKSLDANIDAFVEAYMGTYGRPSAGKTLPVKNLTSQGMKAYLRKTRGFLIKTLPTKIHPDDKDLLAIRDTILGDVDKAMYLFTLA